NSPITLATILKKISGDRAYPVIQGLTKSGKKSPAKWMSSETGRRGELYSAIVGSVNIRGYRTRKNSEVEVATKVRRRHHTKFHAHSWASERAAARVVVSYFSEGTIFRSDVTTSYFSGRERGQY